MNTSYPLRTEAPRQIGAKDLREGAQQVIVFLDGSPHGTLRLWIWGLNRLDERNLEQYSHLQQVLNKTACWGGADKRDFVDYKLATMSWELSKEIGPALYAVVKEFFNKLPGCEVLEGFEI